MRGIYYRVKENVIIRSSHNQPIKCIHYEVSSKANVIHKGNLPLRNGKCIVITIWHTFS